MSAGTALLTLGGAVLLGFVVPWLAMRALMPSLTGRPGSTVTNYRGREVSAGLGIVWFVWAGCAIVGGVASIIFAAESVCVVLALAGPLALVAFAAGVVDDAYGSSDAKGFRGHLKAMLRGRLTTGGLKLLVIGTACLVASLIISRVSPWGASDSLVLDAESLPRYLFGSLVAGASIALTSNFLNLMDLRPGRALKAYSLLAVLGALSAAFLLPMAGWSVADAPALDRALDAAALAVFLLGPVVAVWHYDLGEVGMLGDAGANPMGAVAGLLLVSGFPMWALIVYAVVMFGLNLASERFSFSKVIEATPLLRWLDGLGRLPASEDPQAEHGRVESQETRPHEGGSPE